MRDEYNNENYCIKCEVLIRVPSAFDKLIQSKDQPVKYKSGWMCSGCARRR